MRSVDIPLGAAINAIAGLTGPALMQLNARTIEADPEVPEDPVSEDGEFIVDPGERRRPGVAGGSYVRGERRGAAPRGAAATSIVSAPLPTTELDDADAWARDVGLL